MAGHYVLHDKDVNSIHWNEDYCLPPVPTKQSLQSLRFCLYIPTKFQKQKKEEKDRNLPENFLIINDLQVKSIIIKNVSVWNKSNLKKGQQIYMIQ